MEFTKSNMIVHPVETQWHYAGMVRKGWIPITKSAKGFVRSYIYKHPESTHQIKLKTGVNADYWIDLETGDQSFWATLESHLNKLN